jgi:hypothetical protein
LLVVDDAGWPVATLTLAADTIYYFSGEAFCTHSRTRRRRHW